jgi:hypothetical protein
VAAVTAVGGLAAAAARMALTLDGHPNLPYLDLACLVLWLTALTVIFAALRRGPLTRGRHPRDAQPAEKPVEAAWTTSRPR